MGYKIPAARRARASALMPSRMPCERMPCERRRALPGRTVADALRGRRGRADRRALPPGEPVADDAQGEGCEGAPVAGAGGEGMRARRG